MLEVDAYEADIELEAYDAEILYDPPVTTPDPPPFIAYDADRAYEADTDAEANEVETSTILEIEYVTAYDALATVIEAVMLLVMIKSPTEEELRTAITLPRPSRT